MPNYNRVILMGHLTRDPELRTTQSGLSIVKFSIAVNERYKDKEKTHFFDCTAFGKLAEIIDQYMEKGRPIHVEGSLNHETWQNDAGENRSKVTVTVNNMVFIPQADRKGSKNGSAKPKAQKQEPAPLNDQEMDDCPF